MKPVDPAGVAGYACAGPVAGNSAEDTAGRFAEDAVESVAEARQASPVGGQVVRGELDHGHMLQAGTGSDYYSIVAGTLGFGTKMVVEYLSI